MAQKRLSALFSLPKSQSTSNLSQSSGDRDRDSSQERIGRPQQKQELHLKLQKPRITSDGSNPPPAAFFQDIEPPQFPSQRKASNSPSSYGGRPGSRVGSPSNSHEGSRSRPQTPVLLTPSGVEQSSSRPGTPTSSTLKKRRSWMPGSGGKSDKGNDGQITSEAKAWIAGLREHIPYDIVPLLNGTSLTDLWNEEGDVFIYLFPRSSGKGPSIKIHSSLFDGSTALQNMLFASTNEQVGRNPHLLNRGVVPEEQLFHVQSPGGSTTFSTAHAFPPTDALSRMTIYQNGLHVERHVYLPLKFDDVGLAHPGGQAKGDDLEMLVLYRNFFAFLLGGALISTPRQVSLFSIFLGISTILNRFEFTNLDGSTYGDVAAHSFTRYQDELRLADVRVSREKTIEAIVLGEKMKSWALYNEGFTHAVGKLDDMKNIHSPKYDMISQETQVRMERALYDLHKRVMALKLKIDDFDFPSMFSGIANSVTEKESKLVRFKAWKASFLAFRKHTLDHYRHKYGAWPPKANSKKHNFEGSGLNRVLLLEMYRDFTDLYDMLVDRSNLTSRSADLYALADDADNDANESLQHAMRRVESEYDRSGVPVLPPIPFDVPLIPSFSGSFNRQHVMIPNKSAATTRRMKDNEVNEVLLGSYNRQSMKATPWLQDFLNYERRTGHGKTMDEIVDMRCGQWLFAYAILQTLPNLVVDARELKYSDGVEYFLCIAPRGGRPWVKEDSGQASRSWYNVASGGGLVSLPSDVIDHGVEGIYRRSHCWSVATQWAQDIGAISPTTTGDAQLPPPPVFPSDSPRLSPHVSPYLTPNSRPGSPAISEGGGSGRLSRNGDRNSVHLGLQAVGAPTGVRSRPVSTYNPNMTFDTILGTTSGTESPGKKKGKK